ncbi:hypothetical protein PHLGIDRAFT_177901 [Phlebiopsis gigantea 11061_1 CR5-6]|uniref:Uncharacterized protein n=1 Tax=Phlebiopsis gigantea (strain 11061_1 CR5-6) TaxID=745531 RepID=A0A0C3NJ24_PHLG1|nr:hypothetical protein PHLGIDRAFT_177901 [Phlebiopsis gigantea 11061_1 CR5-6]
MLCITDRDRVSAGSGTQIVAHPPRNGIMLLSESKRETPSSPCPLRRPTRARAPRGSSRNLSERKAAAGWRCESDDGRRRDPDPCCVPSVQIKRVATPWWRRVMRSRGLEMSSIRALFPRAADDAVRRERHTRLPVLRGKSGEGDTTVQNLLHVRG